MHKTTKIIIKIPADHPKRLLSRKVKNRLKHSESQTDSPARHLVCYYSPMKTLLLFTVIISGCASFEATRRDVASEVEAMPLLVSQTEYRQALGKCGDADKGVCFDKLFYQMTDKINSTYSYSDPKLAKELLLTEFDGFYQTCKDEFKASLPNPPEALYRIHCGLSLYENRSRQLHIQRKAASLWESK